MSSEVGYCSVKVRWASQTEWNDKLCKHLNIGDILLPKDTQMCSKDDNIDP